MRARARPRRRGRARRGRPAPGRARGAAASPTLRVGRGLDDVGGRPGRRRHRAILCADAPPPVPDAPRGGVVLRRRRPPGRPGRGLLNDEGRAQAEAARALLEDVTFDRVLASGLARTVETARIVAPDATLEEWEELRSCAATGCPISRSRSSVEFVHAFRGVVPNDKRFLGGETVGELFDRVLPALERLLADGAGTRRSPCSTEQ